MLRERPDVSKRAERLPRQPLGPDGGRRPAPWPAAVWRGTGFMGRVRSVRWGFQAGGGDAQDHAVVAGGAGDVDDVPALGMARGDGRARRGGGRLLVGGDLETFGREEVPGLTHHVIVPAVRDVAVDCVEQGVAVVGCGFSVSSNAGAVKRVDRFGVDLDARGLGQVLGDLSRPGECVVAGLDRQGVVLAGVGIRHTGSKT